MICNEIPRNCHIFSSCHESVKSEAIPVRNLAKFEKSSPRISFSGARYPQFRFGGSLWVTGPRVKLALKTVKSRDSKLYSVKFVKFGFPKTHVFFTKFTAIFARSHLLLGSLGVVYPMAKAKASVRETAKPAVPR